MTRLRQKFIEDLEIRNYAPSTIRASVRHVAALAKYFSQSPDRLGRQQIHHYQLYLVRESKLATPTVSQIVAGLRFFYETTLGRKWISEQIFYPRHERRLPCVLSRGEVSVLLDTPRNLKHRALLMTLYGAGLRVSELVGRQLDDIDSKRKFIRVRQRQRTPRPGNLVAPQAAGSPACRLESFAVHGVAVSRTVAGLDKIEIMLLSQLGLHSR